MTTTTQARFTALLEKRAAEFKKDLLEDRNALNTGTWRLVDSTSLDTPRHVAFSFNNSQITMRGYDRTTRGNDTSYYDLWSSAGQGVTLDDMMNNVLAFLLGCEVKHNKVVNAAQHLTDVERGVVPA